MDFDATGDATKAATGINIITVSSLSISFLMQSYLDSTLYMGCDVVVYRGRMRHWNFGLSDWLSIVPLAVAGFRASAGKAKEWICFTDVNSC